MPGINLSTIVKQKKQALCRNNIVKNWFMLWALSKLRKIYYYLMVLTCKRAPTDRGRKKEKEKKESFQIGLQHARRFC